MSGGCTSCGNKGGCDSRKHEMMEAIDAALARVYPSRRWGEWDPEIAMQDGVAGAEREAFAEELRRRLRTTVVERAGREDELCDYVYVLCVGREPALAHLLPEVFGHEGVGGTYDDATDAGGELYLRVALSSVSKLAAVQEVSMVLESRSEGGAVLVERPRAGVFSPVLLKRLQVIVAVLAERDIRHLDFGDLLAPPVGYDAGAYGEVFEGAPVLANYFFFPQPSTTSSVLPVTLTSPSS